MHAGVLLAAAEPLVVDLGYGAEPATTLELAARLQRLCPAVRVVGIENDRERVAVAQRAGTSAVTFSFGGFDCASLRPTVIRAMNVLRQYEEAAVPVAWQAMTAALAPGGLLIDGTCDELGRRCCWVALRVGGPHSVTFSAQLDSLPAPSALAERLPKVLIHHNVPGQPVHSLLAAADTAWRAASTPYGPRHRWQGMCAALKANGWPLLDGPRRWRLGELTVAWDALRPG